jgi:hypothetical protein
MNRDDVAEPADRAGEVRHVRLVKVMDHRKARIIGIIDDGSGEGAEDPSFKLYLKIAAIIVSGIFLACFFTQLIGASTSVAFILLAAQAALLAYGVFEWFHNPRM